MSCNGCFQNFGVFRKEQGCANCGFSFCSKCLSRVKVPVPRQGNARYPVCAKCFHTLTVTQAPQHTDSHQHASNTVPADPKPSTSQKEDLLPPSMRQHHPVGATHVPIQPPPHAGPGTSPQGAKGDLLPPSMRQHYPVGVTRISVGPLEPDPKPEGDLLPPSMRQHYPVGATKVVVGPKAGGSHKEGRKGGGSKTGSREHLEERLEKLKSDRKGKEGGSGGVPSQAEIETRLADLKGVDPSLVRQPRKFFYEEPDRRGETEKERDLIGQAREEVELDRKITPPDVDIARRLARLRGEEPAPTAQDNLPTNQNQDVPAGRDTQNNDSNTTDTSGVNSSSFLGTERSESETSGGGAEIDEMLRRAGEEAERDARLALEGIQKDQELQAQLRRLTAETRQETLKDEKIQAVLSRGYGGGGQEEDSALEDDDEETLEDRETENIVNRIMEEAELEERRTQAPSQSHPKDPESCADEGVKKRQSEKSTSFRDSLKKRFSWKKPKPSDSAPSPSPPVGAGGEGDPDKEALGWCSVCTEDAAVRCRGCEGDLYCRKCFKEGHDRADLKKHKWVVYKKKIETTV